MVITVWMIFACHKFYSGSSTCDGWIMFAMIALTVIYVIYGGWRKEPICMFVLNFVLCASAFPHVRKATKKIIKK